MENNDLRSCRTLYLRETKLLSIVIDIHSVGGVYIRHYMKEVQKPCG